MSYTDQQQLETAFGRQILTELTDRGTPPTGAPDAGVIRAAIDAAAALIDSHLSGRYAVPVVSPPAVLAGIAADLVISGLYLDSVPEPIAARRTEALRLLRDIRDGRMSLAVAPATIAATGTGMAFAGDRRMMTRTGLRGF